MFIHCELVVLILALTLDGHVHTGKIYGGRQAMPHSRPYMVLLERHMEDDSKRHCGGFLLNEDFVMTAAHCQAKLYSVLLGVHNVHESHEIQRISVRDVFPHKDYNKTEFKNDIMLLKLSSKATFSKNVSPIPLAGKDDGSLPKSCMVSGWGRSDKNIKYMCHVLMEVNVTLIENEQCAADKLYCSAGETGPAEGDSGGPLVCNDGNAYGVVSHTFKPETGGPHLHGYAKISDHRSWISSVMKQKIL